LDRLILKLLAKNPEDRYTTAKEAGEAILSVQTHGLVEEPIRVGINIGTETILLLDKLARGRMVGRQEEMSQLRDLWKHVWQGHSRLLLLSGEPGVGKTRLARELMVYAQLNGAIILQGGCYEYEASTPYLPIAEALREWIRLQSPAALQAQLGTLAPELAKLAPEIEIKLGTQVPNPPLSPNEERLRLFDHITRFMERLAVEHGLLLFIDDIHWADQGTLALLHYLLRNLRSMPIMVLAAYREVELDRTHPFSNTLVELNRERLAMRVQLNRLSREDVGQLLSALFGEESSSMEFIEAIYDETEGNPFFIEEVIKSLIEQGQIYRVDGRWGRKDVAHLTIPQSIREAIGRRLNRLDESCISVLHTAAVLGKRFTYTELVTTSAENEEHVLDALDRATNAQLIKEEESDRSSKHGDENFTFTHDKIREVLYEELNPIRRRRLHKHVGERLEKLFIEDPAYAEVRCYVQNLAYHFSEAGELEKAMNYSIQSAEQAERFYVHEEAINYYDRAVECAETLNMNQKLVKIYEAIGHVEISRGMQQSAIQSFQKALEYATEPHARAELKVDIGTIYATLNDIRGLDILNTALTELDAKTQANEVARTLTNIGRYYHYRFEFDHAIYYLKRAWELAEPFDDPSTLVYIYAYLSGAYQQSGRWEDSMEWAQRCIAFGERKDFPAAIAIGHEFIAENMQFFGQWRQALENASIDYEIGKKIGSMDRMAWAQGSNAIVYHGLGELIKARSSADEAIFLAERTGDMRVHLYSRTRRAMVLTDLGEDEAAQADIAFTKARADEIKARQIYGWIFNMLVYIYIQREDWENLLDYVDEMEKLLEIHYEEQKIIAHVGLNHLEIIAQLIHDLETWDIRDSERPDGGLYWLMLGRAYSVLKDWQRSIQAFDRSIRIHKSLESQLMVGRVMALRAIAESNSGDRQVACADLRQALEIFVTCNAKHDADRTRQQLETLKCT
jgi:tetratricopeptide (TPR) repeat protein